MVNINHLMDILQLILL